MSNTIRGGYGSLRGQYGRRGNMTYAEFTLLAEALAATQPPTPQDYAMVWGLFVWSAETLHHHCHKEKGTDDALLLEWRHVSRIMRTWGYLPGVRQACRDFDNDCKAEHRKQHGAEIATLTVEELEIKHGGDYTR